MESSVAALETIVEAPAPAAEPLVPDREGRHHRRTTDLHAADIEGTRGASDEAQRRDAVFRRLLAAADVLSATAALTFIGLAMAPELLAPWTLVALPLIVLTAKTMGLYDRDELVLHKTTLNDAPGLFQLTAVLTLFLTVSQGALHDSPQAPQRMLVLWGLLFAGTLTSRSVARRVARAVTPKERCVLVGDVAHAARVRRMLSAHDELGAELVATIPFERVTARGEDSEAFGEYLARSNFHRVIVTHTAAEEDLADTIRIFKSSGIKVSVLPSLFDALGSAVEFEHLSGATLLGVRRYGLTRSSQALKRAMDVTVACLGLLALAPVLAIVAAAIVLDSKGPVFFRQTRVGRRGETFRIVKFRTMFRDADERKADLLALNETQGVL